MKPRDRIRLGAIPFPRRQVRPALALLVLPLLPLLPAATAAAQSVVPRISMPLLLHVGYTTFDKPEKVLRGETSLESVTAYLDMLTQQSGRRPLDFDLHLGNYYQILSWLESKDLDAAVVSPFMAWLLKEKGIAAPLVEFTQGDNADGHWSIICSTDAAGRKGKDAQDYEAYLGELLAAAQEHPGECPLEARWRRYQINVVAHPSTTGFIAPVLYASDWLAAQHAPDPIQERFWDCFFENVTFTLAHSARCPIAGSPGRPRITFDYSVTRPPRSAHSDRFGFRDAAGAPPIPNDVLMVRPEIKELLERPLPASASTPGIYTGFRPYQDGLHERFGEQVSKLAVVRALEPRFVSWYGLGKYDFSVEDISSFLLQDQELSDRPHLSLVLPGGGVKSAYQAALLDRLYGEGVLANFGRQHLGQGPLVVADVVGTSGGAMVGLFTAQKKGAGDKLSLRRLWQPGPKVFPPFDMLRWTSLFAILVLFFLLLYAARMVIQLDLGGGAARIDPDRTPYWLSLALLAILLGGPFLVSWVLWSTDQPEMPWAEGLLYLLTILAVYVALACCVDRQAGGEVAAKKFPAASTFVLLLAAGSVAAGCVARWPIAVSLGLLGAVIGAVLAAAERRLGLRLAGIGDCARALSFLGLLLALSYALFAVLSLGGWATFIELTRGFWLLLLLSAGAVSIFCLVVAQWGKNGFARYLRRAIHYFGTVHRVGSFHSEHALSLTILFGAGLLWWSWVAAPAIYSGKMAYESFKSMVGASIARQGVDRPVDLRTNLIVTATALNDIKDVVPLNGSKQRLPLPAGDVYFCFPGPNRCPDTVQSKRWFEIPKPSVRNVVDPVFASGSPFPVFPPHPVSWNCRGPAPAKAHLVDGGYAHNVPLQAASLAGARQVLIVRSEPLDSPAVSQSELFPSQLARYVQLLLPFMYERAQEIDRSVARGLVVASLSPYATGRKIPLLTDFDSVTIQRMLKDADEDYSLHRRIGLVESWGLPVVFRRIRPGKLPRDMFQLNGPRT